MLNAEVKLLTVDWEALLQALLPKMVSRTQAMENPSFLVTLFNRLGASSTGALSVVLNTLSEETRSELTCYLLNQYRDKILEKLNESLPQDSKIHKIHLGGFYARRDEGLFVSLCLTNIVIHLAPQASGFAVLPAAAASLAAGKTASWVLKRHAGVLTRFLQEKLEAQGLKGIETEVALLASGAEEASQADPDAPLSDAAQQDILDALVRIIGSIERMEPSA